ncbi:hypothetical protein PSH79_11385 [Pseudomonas sp. FP2196]|nr:hypothetical protein [Pseudomonas sp. FP2196]WLH37870.1 hypothetical protein PSH79_11385 [Pseudomonas sp. FP2196]
MALLLEALQSDDEVAFFVDRRSDLRIGTHESLEAKEVDLMS